MRVKYVLERISNAFRRCLLIPCSDIFNSNAERLESSGLSYFVFESDSLVAWSTNTVPLSDRLDKLIEAGPLYPLAKWMVFNQRA